MTAGGSGDGFVAGFVWCCLSWDEFIVGFVVGVSDDLDLFFVLDRED